MPGFVAGERAGPTPSQMPTQMPTQIPTPSADLVRRTQVVRQAIYDAKRSVVAFQLLFRCADDGASSTEQGTSQLIASTLGAFDVESIAAGRPVFVNLTRSFVTGVIPIPLDPSRLVVEIDGSMVADRELAVGVRTLAENGYRIAVNGVEAGPAHAGLLDVADFVGVDVAGLSSPAVPTLVEQARDGGASLIASGIEDVDTLRRCQALGFELFRGPFLQRPSIIEGRSLSPIQLVCVRLLGLLNDEDASMSQLEQLVGVDPGLSMRLLRTANSAASGVRSEVTSLRQAIVLLGPPRLRAWVVLTLLEGGATRERTDDLWNVLARAIACQKLAPGEPDLGYTVGLLYGCAELLGVDAESVANGSGLSGRARGGLVERVGPAGSALSAVIAHENDDMNALTATGLMPFDVSRAYLEALSESLTLIHGLSAPPD